MANRPPVEIRVTRHIRGGFAPGYWYHVDPDDPFVRESVADGVMILRSDDPYAAASRRNGPELPAVDESEDDLEDVGIASERET